MLLSGIKYGQDKFSLSGGASNCFNTHFDLNGTEGIVSNLSNVKDWEFSFSYGEEFSKETIGNLYSLTLAKRIGNHFFSARYSPGYQKDFLFSSGTHALTGDTIPTTLKSKIHYEEKFGFGYSFRFLPNFSAGIYFRYFAQEFSQDQLKTYFTDSTTSVNIESDTKNYNFWNGDLGISYSPNQNITLGISTINLFAQNITDEQDADIRLKRNKGIAFTADYRPTDFLSSSFTFETSSSFIAGANINSNILDGNLSFALRLLHDKYQEPFVAGIVPTVNFSSEYFSVTFSFLKYISDRKKSSSYSDFSKNGIHNIFNNKYSYDKAMLSVNIALNTIEEKRVKFIDVRVMQNIFPALSDIYLDSPFAVAAVLNLTDKPVVVKPSSYIPSVNKEYVQSPPVTISAKDTAEIPFFTIIDEHSSLSGKAEISQATFLLYTESSNPGDEFRKPVLINDYNSWDGKVINLKYFAQSDIEFAQEFAKEILQKNKSFMDTIPDVLNKFYSAKILFDYVIKDLVYVSDPRASVDRVQFPRETIRLKGGDCDDLSVAFACLFESIGIQTAFVDYKSDSAISHVNIMFNTSLTPEQARLITSNDRKYFLRQTAESKDEVWLPIESTSLTNFNLSWEAAAEKFQTDAIDKFGLAKGLVQIVDIP